MQDDAFPAAEKILSDIENVVRRDPSLKSFEIVPVEDNENRSPVFHQEGSLGLASWCVQPLYCYAYQHLLQLRRNRYRREEPSMVARWLLGALLLNPDVTTFWNMRRELVRSHKLDACEELSLIRLVLYHKPKCFEAFAYRRWLLPRVLDAQKTEFGCSYDPDPADSLLCAEIELVETCADRYANNYHAWSHRRYLITLRESRGLLHPTIESEWSSTLAWCQRHVSDHSAHSYRQFLLRRCVVESTSMPSKTKSRSQRNFRHADQNQRFEEQLLAYIHTNIVRDHQEMMLQSYRDLMYKRSGSSSEKKLRRHLRALSYWAEECHVNEQLISMYCHEALWYHRRFLVYLLARLIALYARHAYYKEDELLDARRRDGPIVLFAREKRAINEPVIAAHVLLLEAFRTGNARIIELAVNRDLHERLHAQKFLKLLVSLGLDESAT